MLVVEHNVFDLEIGGQRDFDFVVQDLLLKFFVNEDALVGLQSVKFYFFVEQLLLLDEVVYRFSSPNL